MDLKKPRCILLIGCPGSGKTTLAKEYEKRGFIRISQDEHGKEGHMFKFRMAFNNRENILIDRMNFNKEQRNQYIRQLYHYQVEIIVLKSSYKTCLKRILERKNHPTIKTELDAKSALHLFFKNYEEPTKEEANKITYR